jgi:hypothetical protein
MRMFWGEWMLWRFSMDVLEDGKYRTKMQFGRKDPYMYTMDATTGETRRFKIYSKVGFITRIKLLLLVLRSRKVREW